MADPKEILIMSELFSHHSVIRGDHGGGIWVSDTHDNKARYSRGASCINPVDWGEIDTRLRSIEQSSLADLPRLKKEMGKSSLNKSGRHLVPWSDSEQDEMWEHFDASEDERITCEGTQEEFLEMLDEKQKEYDYIRYAVNTQAFEWDHLNDGNPYLFRYEHNMCLWDEHEMHWDMCKWEDEEAQHELFSENTWEKRGNLVENVMNRRSETTTMVEVTKVGRDYLTGTTPFGKVYVPKHIWNSEYCSGDDRISLFMRIRFLGFEGCRPSRTMPWRAMELISSFHSG